MIKSVLFWDIDGTLLTTARAGISAWEGSFEEVAGRQISFANLKTAGLTDVEIAAILAREYGDTRNETVQRLLHGYEDRLPACLPSRQGQVFPGVIDILNRLQNMPSVYSLLLTGNTKRGAAAKLTHYGLRDFFKTGAFSDGLPDRPSIAYRAMQIVKDNLDTCEIQEFFVIGDTPHDIHCGNAISAKTVAVCTGGYDREALLAHKPSIIFDSFADTDEFFKRLGIIS